jgi:hypothetical protein
MSRVPSLLVSASFLAAIPFLVLGPTPVLAVSPSQLDCEAAGGTFDRTGGQVSCTFTTTEHVGNSDNSQTVTNTDTDSSNGTLNNDPQFDTTSDCSGPGNSTGSAHCK